MGPDGKSTAFSQKGGYSPTQFLGEKRCFKLPSRLGRELKNPPAYAGGSDFLLLLSSIAGFAAGVAEAEEMFSVVVEFGSEFKRLSCRRFCLLFVATGGAGVCVFPKVA